MQTIKNPNWDTNANSSTTPSVILPKDSSQGATNSTWIPNSGAYFHVTSEPQSLHQLSQFDGPDHIFIANGLMALFLLSSVSH